MSFANNDSFTSFLAIWMPFISFPCLIAVARTPAAAKSLQLCPTLCDPVTVAHQGPLSMGFPRQEYWSALPFPSPGDVPVSRMEPTSPILTG